MSCVTAPFPVVKQPAEVLLVEFDLANLLVTDETIDSVTSVVEVTTADLSLGSPSLSGNSILVSVAGGDDGTTYRLQYTFVTSLHSVRQADLLVEVSAT